MSIVLGCHVPQWEEQVISVPSSLMCGAGRLRISGPRSPSVINHNIVHRRKASCHLVFSSSSNQTSNAEILPFIKTTKDTQEASSQDTGRLVHGIC
jgi:hypothetical protein